MSTPTELVDVLSRVANIFLKAVDALETRMNMIEQRLDELLRTSGSYGVPGPQPQDTRRAPSPSSSPAPPTPTPQAYASPQPQWGAQREGSYPQPAAPSYQNRPPAPSYPPQGQQPQQQGYPPQGYPSQGYSPQAQQQGQQPQQQGYPPQGPPAPRPPTSPLNIRQEMTGELKDVFAKMRARAEGRQ